MFKVICSSEYKGRIIKVLKKAQIYKVEDSKEKLNVIFIKEQDALNLYHQKLESFFQKEMNV